MITKTMGYKSSDGTIHGSLVECQKAEIRILLSQSDSKLSNLNSVVAVENMAEVIFTMREQLVDILTTTNTSKPRARRINGGTKTRAKKSTRYEAEQFPLPMEDSPKPAA